jgi:hypothetical protein
MEQSNPVQEVLFDSKQVIKEINAAQIKYNEWLQPTWEDPDLMEGAAQFVLSVIHRTPECLTDYLRKGQGKNLRKLLDNLGPEAQEEKEQREQEDKSQKGKKKRPKKRSEMDDEDIIIDISEKLTEGQRKSLTQLSDALDNLNGGNINKFCQPLWPIIIQQASIELLELINSNNDFAVLVWPPECEKSIREYILSKLPEEKGGGMCNNQYASDFTPTVQQLLQGRKSDAEMVIEWCHRKGLI